MIDPDSNYDSHKLSILLNLNCLVYNDNDNESVSRNAWRKFLELLAGFGVAFSPGVMVIQNFPKFDQNSPNLFLINETIFSPNF